MKVTLNIDANDIIQGFESAKTLTAAHHRCAKHYASPLILGPALSEDLLELVTHMFTEDEADVVQHLSPLIPRSVRSLSRYTGCSESNVERVIEHLTNNKRILVSLGGPPKKIHYPAVDARNP